jgi:hydrogenase/urease accessory protein HupE
MLVLLFCFMGSAAHADELRPGYIEFTQISGPEWSLVWKVPIKAGFTPFTRPVLPDGCATKGAPSRSISRASVVTTSSVFCTNSVASDFIGLENFGGAQSDVLVRVAPAGRPVQVLRLTAAQPRARIKAKPGRFLVAQTYFTTGVGHIIFGYDHLLFVVALVILLPGFLTVLKAVTAFTVAHSLTLIGTTLGLIGLPQDPVESVIALSIMFLAAEILKRKRGEVRLSQRIPWIVSFGFGLLHGFGFAGALKEIGLPENDVPTALLTFNLGVEAGQLVIVAVTIACLSALRNGFSRAEDLTVKLVTYAIGITASFWFIERTLM